MKLTPIEYASWVFGGRAELAQAIGIQRGTMNVWDAHYGIPAKRQRQLLSIAKSAGLDLTAEHLINGGDIPYEITTTREGEWGTLHCNGLEHRYRIGDAKSLAYARAMILRLLRQSL